jgi:microcystin-dependent protein
MAVSITSYPYDAGAGAVVTEAGWYPMARLWLPDGVMDNLLDEFEVFADATGGLNVKVRSGQAWIQGQFVQHTAQETLTLATADASNPRIDRVIIRVDWTANTAALDVLTGTPAVTPSAPALTQNAGASWEYALAQVRVEATATSITANKVTDERTFPRIDQGIPPGTLADYCAVTAPRGWLLCYGQAVSRVTYARLFNILGDAFGAGDGATTFHLPDLRGRVGVGLDGMGGSNAGRVPAASGLNLSGGAATHTLTSGELPSHLHAVNPPGTVSGGESAGHTHQVNPPSTTSGGESAAHTHQIDPPLTQSSGESADHTHQVDPPNTTSTGGTNHLHEVNPPNATSASEATHTHQVNPPATLSQVESATHAHTVAASAAVASSSNGAHTHSVHVSTTGVNTVMAQAAGINNPPGIFNNALTSEGGHTHTTTVPAHTTDASPASNHLHNVDIAEFSSSAGTGHSHNIDIAPFNSGGETVHSHDVNIAPFQSAGVSLNHAHDVNIAAFSSAAASASHSHDVDIPAFASADVSASHTHGVDIAQFDSGSTGGGGPHNNLQPWIALTKIIKT